MNDVDDGYFFDDENNEIEDGNEREDENNDDEDEKIIYYIEEDENEDEDKRNMNEDVAVMDNFGLEEEDMDEDDETDEVPFHYDAPNFNHDEKWEITRLKALSTFTISPDWEESMTFLYWKCNYACSDTGYGELLDRLASLNVHIHSLRASRNYLESHFNIHIQQFDRYINNCMVFIGKHKLLRRCYYCKAPRFLESPEAASQGDFLDMESYANLKPRAVYSFIPLIPRLKLLYANPEYARKMRYRRTLMETPWNIGIRDVWDGRAMRHWKAEGYFNDDRTVALHFSTDGVQLFKNSTQEVWPFLLLNLNLPPEERYNNENFLPFGLCPGPKQPKDLDSFLEPFIDELDLLNKGVPAYDAATESPFILKAYLVLLSGDSPGVAKLLHFNGHSAKYPCRACKLAGIAHKIPFEFKKGSRRGQIGEKTQYYYPLHPPTNGRHPQDVINLKNLIRRLPQTYFEDGQASLQNPENAINSGVKGISPLARLPTISIPESSPFDFMHLMYISFVRDLCALLSGKFFKNAELNEYNGRMAERDWEDLGLDMEKIEAPASWGRYPRNIQKYIGTFKAEELQNFLIHYLLPLSFDRVNRTTYQALQRLVLITSLATAYQITNTEIDEIEQHLIKFIKWYYDTFYQYRSERLPACKYTVHCLLHLVHDLRNWGPVSYYWQFPEERLCGILVNAVKSRVHGSANLTVLMHQHQLLCFAEKFGMVKKRTPQDKSFTTPEYAKSLYYLLPPHKSANHKLSGTSLQRLKQYYMTIYSISRFNDPELAGMDPYVQLWYRCRADKVIFHSAQYLRSNSTRLNHLVRVEAVVDANANFSYNVRDERMVPAEYYGYIQYFFVHSFREISHMLMYCDYRYIEIHDGLVEEKGHWHYDVQDIRMIQHLCAKVKARGKVYFVDAPEVMEERIREALTGL